MSNRAGSSSSRMPLMPISTHSRRFLLITVIQFLSLLNADAQGALCSWLSVEKAEQGRQYLFRRTYVSDSAVAEANVTIAANGSFRLFVNGRAVFTSFFPCGDNGVTLDVTPYMRNDSNTVAVWYAPDVRCAQCPSSDANPMVALCLYGRYVSEKPFIFATDTTWLCAPLNVLSSSEGEIENALEYVSGGNLDDAPVPMKWGNSVNSGVLWTQMSPVLRGRGFSDSAVQIVKPSSFDVLDDENAVSYNFNKPFYGTFRLTVRNAKAGERIWAGGSEYVCRGVLDEQFVGRFVLKGIRRIIVSGDGNFKKSHIVKVEGIALSPADHIRLCW